MTTIIMVRHGQTTSNVTGFYMGWAKEDLNEMGREQARRLSRRLAGTAINAAYSSPLPRALSTATILVEPHQGLKVNTLEDLMEIKLGWWQGLYRDEIKRTWPELWRQVRTDPSNVTFPDGESFTQITARAIRALDYVVAANPGQTALMVTHDIIIRILVAHILGVTNQIYRRIEIQNASLTIFHIRETKALVHTLNDTGHLYGLEGAFPVDVD